MKYGGFAVAATALLVATPSLLNGFVYDDVAAIVENPILHSLRNSPHLWVSNYRKAALYARLAISIDWERPAFRIALATADSALRAGAPPGTVRLTIPPKYVIAELLTVGARK